VGRGEEGRGGEQGRKGREGEGRPPNVRNALTPLAASPKIIMRTKFGYPEFNCFCFLVVQDTVT